MGVTPQTLQVFDLLKDRENLTHALLVMGIALVTTSLLMRYRKRRRKQTPLSLTPHEQIERMKQHRGMRGDLEDLMVEIEQLSRRFAAQLDAKSIQLERLLDQADERIAKLDRLSTQVGSADYAGRTGADFTDTVGGGAASDPNEQMNTNGKAQADDALSRSVYALADQGLGPADIAQKLGELVGKIELILALRDAGNQSA